MLTLLCLAQENDFFVIPSFMVAEPWPVMYIFVGVKSFHARE